MIWLQVSRRSHLSIKNVKSVTSLEEAKREPILIDIPGEIPAWMLLAHMILKQDPTAAFHAEREGTGIDIYAMSVDDMELERRPIPPHVQAQFKDVEKVWLIYKKKGVTIL